jgi:magnesium chelatase family protein
MWLRSAMNKAGEKRNIMVAKVKTVAFQGVKAIDVDVEVQISSGLVAFSIVGLPDKAVAESRERVRSALHAMGLSLPSKRLTVNLAPADVLKEGSHYDLPIALGILTAMEVLPSDVLQNYYALGELSLDGTLRSVAGVLPASLHAHEQNMGLICPHDTGAEAAWAGSGDVLAPRTLLQFINHAKGVQVMTPPIPKLRDSDIKFPRDLAEVKGQETAKRALEIAAAGGHNLLMIGPPGSGKSMLASCLPSILPPLSPKEALEISIIHSIAGSLPEGGLVAHRPYRDPHHTASLPALIGGGARAKPGEISLAHHGVLFLDELPEFPRASLESLRQPLESGETLVARVNYHVTYPARFQLIAAMNPCRCGYLGDPSQECTKAPRCGDDYQSKLSGPLLDRIDMHVDVPPVSVMDLTNAPTGESSSIIRDRIMVARARQKSRFESFNADVEINAHASGKLLDDVTAMTSEARSLMERAATKMNLSARTWHRILKVARTVADLAGDFDDIQANHVAEALSYRRIKISD